MPARRRRVTLVLAVTSGILGGGLAGVGGLGMASAQETESCPPGTVLYRLAVPPATPTTTPTVTETTIVGGITDPADPFPTVGTPDPDAFLCVADGKIVAPVGTPEATPAPAVVIPNYELNPPTYELAPPAPVPLLPTPTPAATPSPTPTPTPTEDAPGQIPLPPGGVIPVDNTPNLPDITGSITRDTVIARAASWVLQKVPYSQTSWWSDANGRYRQDCSGYVSMAWGLSQKINYWTGNLATVSHRIASSALRPGDVLLLPRSHVVIFAGWGNSSKTKFHLYEEYSRGKPARYVTNAALSYYLNRGYGAYRYDRIADVEAGTPGMRSTVFETAAVSQPIGLEAQPWSPDLAAQAEPESAAPTAPQGSITPEPVPVVGLPTLIDTQLATDRRAAVESAGSGSGVVLLAAGLGLLFLCFPLTIAARAGAWTPRRPEVTP